MQNTLEAVAPKIIKFFDHAHDRVYTYNNLDNILLQNRIAWQLAKRVNTKSFIEFLTSYTYLRETVLTSLDYAPFRRFVWRNATPYQLALSRKPNAYLSHGTAAFLHKLLQGRTQIVYVNCEQSPKPGSRGLTQAGIDRAFSQKQRRTNLVYENDGWKFVFLSGKSTGNFGVETSEGPSGEPLRVTNLERTLIDIVVRPSYAGGVATVLECYKKAKRQVKISRVITILKKLDHAYPYHQAVGFLMQKAGYSARDYTRLRALGLKFDFYLAHNIHNKSYEPYWRLYHPKQM